MQSLNSNAQSPTRRSRLTLWLIVALCAAPVIASYVVFYGWHPSARVNYGELIEPRPVPIRALRAIDGRTVQWSDLRGQWVLLTVDSGRCDERCRTKLLYMRQVRLAQGKEAERIERVWLVNDGTGPDPALLADHPGLIVAPVGESELAALPAARSAADHVYVVDPLGNVMMRFPRDADPRRMLKDLARLLRHSRWK
jgi:hypothetical protein